MVLHGPHIAHLTVIQNGPLFCDDGNPDIRFRQDRYQGIDQPEIAVSENTVSPDKMIGQLCDVIQGDLKVAPPESFLPFKLENQYQDGEHQENDGEIQEEPLSESKFHCLPFIRETQIKCFL